MPYYVYTYTSSANTVGAPDKFVQDQITIVDQSNTNDAIADNGELLLSSDGQWYRNLNGGTAGTKTFYKTASVTLADGTTVTIGGSLLNYQLLTLQPVTASGVATGAPNVSVITFQTSFLSSPTRLFNFSSPGGSSGSATFTDIVAAHGDIVAIDTQTVSPGGTGSAWILTSTDFFVCFAAGTKIETDRGEVPVEDLQVEDLVRTKDHGFQTIRWTGKAQVSDLSAKEKEHLRPIRIRAGALGDGLPETNLFVSPQHRVLVKSKVAHRLCGFDEVLVAAKHLLEVDGIDVVQDRDEVTYVHFLLNQHEIVYANGAETESLYTGPEALKAVGLEAQEEILSLFPELSDIDYQVPSSRVILSGRMTRELAHRHVKNHRPLFYGN